MFRTTTRRANRRDQYENTSIWLINIGTHKKPGNVQEFEILRESLGDAIIRVTNDSTKLITCFMPVIGPRGNVDVLKEPAFRIDEFLKIREIESEYEVELGAKQGRIDAHIVMTVHHGGKIQFDHHTFQELLDEELITENNTFIDNNIRSNSSAGYTHLKWAEPNLYVSFRMVGKIARRGVFEYVTKSQYTTKEGAPPEPQDQSAYDRLVPIALSKTPTPGLDVGVPIANTIRVG